MLCGVSLWFGSRRIRQVLSWKHVVTLHDWSSAETSAIARLRHGLGNGKGASLGRKTIDSGELGQRRSRGSGLLCTVSEAAAGLMLPSGGKSAPSSPCSRPIQSPSLACDWLSAFAIRKSVYLYRHQLRHSSWLWKQMLPLKNFPSSCLQ